MRRFSFMLLMLIPSATIAQGYDNSPILFMNTTSSATKVESSAGATPSQNAASIKPTPTPNASAALPQVPPLPSNFPEWAVSNAAQNTAGNTNPAVASPASLASPAPPNAVASEQGPMPPASPPSPASPVSKLWPSDTVPIFVKSCVGFHVELIPACTCTITELMATMAHDEFLKLSETNAIESDPRLKRARLDCVAAPARKE